MVYGIPRFEREVITAHPLHASTDLFLTDGSIRINDHLMKTKERTK